MAFRVGLPSLLLLIVAVAAVLQVGEAPALVAAVAIILAAPVIICALAGLALAIFLLFLPSKMRDLMSRHWPQMYYRYFDQDDREQAVKDRRSNERLFNNPTSCKKSCRTEVVCLPFNPVWIPPTFPPRQYIDDSPSFMSKIHTLKVNHFYAC